MRKYLLIGVVLTLTLTSFLAACSGKTVGPATHFGYSTTTSGGAVELEFITQPGGAISGQPFTTQPVIAAVDANGKTVADYSAPVTLVIQSGTSGAKLSGTLSVNAVNGIAAFKDISIDLAGKNYMLTALGSDLKSAISSTFTVAPGAPEMLIFTTQPSGGNAGSFFSTQPVVAIEDAHGNIVTGSSAEVTVSIKPGTGTEGAILSGGTTVKAVDGVATFAYLTVDRIGSEYKLIATSPGLKSTESNVFYITAAATTQ